MLKGNQLKFQRGAAAKTEGEDRNNGGENRPHVVTVRPARENHQLFSALWRFEQGQDLGSPGHPASNRSLADFTVDAGRAPQRVVLAHAADQITDLCADLGSPWTA